MGVHHSARIAGNGRGSRSLARLSVTGYTLVTKSRAAFHGSGSESETVTESASESWNRVRPRHTGEGGELPPDCHYMTILEDR